MVIANLFAPLPAVTGSEVFEALLEQPGFRLERIVSTGQATPEGEWLQQEEHEWVLLVTGAASLRVEGDAEALSLKPGDFILIPSGCRHRVEWTDPAQPTVWLALHYSPFSSME